MWRLVLFLQAFDIYRNFFYKRKPLALIAMLLFMATMTSIVAIQLRGNSFFWIGVGIVGCGFLVALPAFIYLVDRGYLGQKPRWAKDELFGPRINR